MFEFRQTVHFYLLYSKLKHGSSLSSFNLYTYNYNFDTSRSTVQYKRTVYNDIQKKYALND